MTTRQHGSPAEAAAGSAAQRVRRHAVSLVWAVRSRAFVDRSDDPADTVLVLGSARSGTTWVGEVLDRHHDHRQLFEPLRPGAVPAMAPFEGVRYLPPDEPAPLHEAAMSALLRGRVRNPWVDHTNRAVVSRRRLLKEIRANCLAPWIAATFPTSPIVLVVRHPLAVAHSRLQLGWSDHLEELLTCAGLRAALGPARAVVDDRLDPVVRAVASWAIETVVPVRDLDHTQAVFTLYEDLRRDPLSSFAPVLERVGQHPDAALEQAVHRPSRTSRPGAGDRSHPLRLSPGQRRECTEILAAFGLDTVYDLDHPAPRAGGLAALRARLRNSGSAVPDQPGHQTPPRSGR